MNKKQVLPIINTLVKVEPDAVFKSIKNIIYHNDKVLIEDQEYTQDEFEERIKILSKMLKLPDLVVEHLYYEWKSGFEKNESLTKKDLLELAKNATLRKEPKSSVLEKYANALKMKFLHHIEHGIAFKDRFERDISIEDKQRYLELAPIVYDMPDKLLNNKQWRYVDTPFEEIKPFELDDVWIDLEFIEPWLNEGEIRDKELDSKHQEMYGQKFSLREPIDLVLEMFQGFMIIVGAPGSGKTTLLKWISRNLIKNPDGKFSLPLFIPLREYAIRKDQLRVDSILDFAFMYAGVNDKDQRDKWINSISYITGTQKDNVLLLLDGWDEVPSDLKERLKVEIEELSYGFSLILTSRHSGYPRSFSADKFYEIGNLNDTQIENLILNYFSKDGKNAQILLSHLKEYQDLYEMGRSPFLLTLLCGIFINRHQFDISELPSSRTEIYSKTLNYIYNHHNKKYPSNLFNEKIKRDIEKLAYYIFTNDKPRYFFDDSDVEICFNDTGKFEDTVKMSRLLSQLRMDKFIYQFIHTTFQEYYIASYLRQGGDIDLFLDKYIYSDSAIEIICFLSGLTDSSKFWDRIKELLRVPDRFGLIYIKVSKMILENKNIGIDIRDRLWKYANKVHLPEPYIKALAKLDIGYLNNKTKVSFENITDTWSKSKLQRALSAIRDENNSLILANQIIRGSKEEAAVASYAIKDIMNYKVKEKFYMELQKKHSFDTYKYIILALGNSKDENSISRIMEFFGYDELRDIVIQALGRIASNNAVDKLIEIFYKYDLKENIIKEIGQISSIYARDRLLEILALLPKSSKLIKVILGAIYELPILDGTGIILGFLDGKYDIEIQEKAILALKQSTKEGVTNRLRDIARYSQSRTLREKALQSLEDRCSSFDMDWLSKKIKDSDIEFNEKLYALEVFIQTCMKLHYRNENIDVRDIILYVLGENSDLAFLIATKFIIKDEVIIDRFIQMFESDDVQTYVKEAICGYFAKLKVKKIVYKLVEIIEKYPDVKDDESIVELDDNKRFSKECALALCKIDLKEAIKLRGTTMDSALLEYALDNGLLIYGNVVYDSNGRNVLEEI